MQSRGKKDAATGKTYCDVWHFATLLRMEDAYGYYSRSPPPRAFAHSLKFSCGLPESRNPCVFFLPMCMKKKTRGSGRLGSQIKLFIPCANEKNRKKWPFWCFLKHFELFSDFWQFWTYFGVSIRSRQSYPRYTNMTTAALNCAQKRLIGSPKALSNPFGHN